jgi:hypothetical protein
MDVKQIKNFLRKKIVKGFCEYWRENEKLENSFETIFLRHLLKENNWLF